MSKKVFMSYSWRDSNIASRIYNDLIRSQVSIWRDKIDGDPIEDFQKEFLSKIDESDYFLLLDSSNYRSKSKWCCTELSRCFENQNRRNAPQIIVCLLEPDGEWRTSFSNDIQKELFSSVNKLKYQNFYFSGYDNNSTYKESISNICEILDLSYVPWGNMPSHQDLMDELFHGQSHEIEIEDVNAVIDEYKIILNKIKKERQNNIQAHFKLWIEDCKEMDLNLYFPEWTCAIWLANNKHEDILLCEKMLINLIKTYPEDPRAYRGLGCIYTSINRYDEAISLLLTAYKLIQSKENYQHKKYCEFEILYNISQTLINIGKYIEAAKYLNEGYRIMLSEGLSNINIIKNIEYVNSQTQVSIHKRINFLNSAILHFPLEDELYKLLGFCYIEDKDNYSAYKAFKKAFSLNPTAETSFHLLCQITNLNFIDEYHKLLNIIFLNDSITQEEDYWKGAIAYFLESNLNKAHLYFNKCDENQFKWYGDI